MNRREFLIAGAAVPIAACARPLHRDDPAALAALEAGAAEFARHAAPGAALSHISPAGRATTLALGVEDLVGRAPVRSVSVFQIASLTKPFTAMIVLMLAEEGRIALDEPARGRLAWLPAAYRDVTIRQLLGHVSGVPADLRRENVDEFGIDEFQRRFVAAEPRFAPGERWEYANAGYTLLSLIAEAAAEEPFGRLLERRIFAPLGMRNSGYRAPLVTAPGRAAGHDWLEEAWRPAPPVYSGWGNSGIETTIDDLARFAAALHRRRLMSAASYEQMLSPAVLAGGVPVAFPFRGAPSSYGLGWFLSDRCGERLAFHGGTIAGFSSMLSWSPGRNVSIAALSNAKSGPDRFGIAEKIATAALAQQLPCPQPG